MIRPVRPDGRIETGGVFVPILRRRVLDRIATAALQRVVLIIAPAGYGKTVALRQFLDTLSEPCVRFDVLPEHDALLGFLRGFADALSDVAPDLRTTLAGAYEKNANSQTPGSDLAMWVHSHIKAYRGAIALDDLQVAQEDREVTRFLSSLIDRTKGRVQWIIASRSTVGLPIGTWLAYGDSDLAIDEHDLKFTVEEAKETARSFKLGVRDEELYELIHLTEGWATAMSFALRSSTRSVDLRNISAMTREMIYRYLAEQVYHDLTDDERSFLGAAALLSEIDVDTMIAAGFDRASASIEELRQRVSFIHQQSPGVYRLHDLFRDFLLRQLSLGGDAQAREARCAIARVLEGKGEYARALALYRDGQAKGDVLRVLDDHGLELLSKGHADVAQFCLDALGPSVADSPISLRIRGVLDIAAGRYDEGERALLRAIKLTEKKDIAAELLIRVSLSRTNRGEDPSSLLESALKDRRFPQTFRLEAESIMSVATLKLAKNVDDGRVHLRAVINALDGVDDDALRARLMQRVGVAQLELGDFEAARLYFGKATDLASNLAMWSLASRGYSGLTNASAYGQGDATLSLWNAQQAATCAAKAGDYYDLQQSLLAILGIETQRGNVERVLQIEKQLAEFRTSDSHRAIYIAESQAHRRAWNREFAEAHRLFTSVKQRLAFSADSAFDTSASALCLALDDRARDSGAVVEEALAALDAAQPTAGGFGSALFEATQLLCALAEAISGRHTSAQRILKRPALSEHRAIVALREAISELVRAAKSRTYVTDDIEGRMDVMRSDGFGGFARYVSLARARIEGGNETEETIRLTPSELRIIRLLAAGLAPKDVAAEMGRSVYTIQTHIQNLIEKLGCHGRAEAIAAARRMGLLDEAL